MAKTRRNIVGTTIDLFCGCGGFSLGAELAGFHTLAAIDIDSTLQSAFRKNFPNSTVITSDISDIDRSAWRRFLGDARPDGIIGGPPCQGFSAIGRRRKNDPRNSLIHKFVDQVDLLQPKFFIMENVEGLLRPENERLLSSAIDRIPSRYRVLEPTVVNAADFGAATARRRVVIVGYDPNEVERITEECLQSASPGRLITVRDAISDLPRPIRAPEDEADFGWASYPTNKKISDYAARLRAAAPRGLGWTEGLRKHTGGCVSGLISTLHSKTVAERYRRLAGGRSDPITKSYRLKWNGQCPTLRAGTGAEKGAFQAVRPIHPGQGRVITVREAARLQGFPDWFVFHNTKWHSFRMIGNSVSPIFSQGLLERIAQRMQLSLAA